MPCETKKDGTLTSEKKENAHVRGGREKKRLKVKIWLMVRGNGVAVQNKKKKA